MKDVYYTHELLNRRIQRDRVAVFTLIRSLMKGQTGRTQRPYNSKDEALAYLSAYQKVSRAPVVCN